MSIDGEGGVIYPYPHRTFQRYTEGFSYFLGWLRERNFQPLDS